MAEPGEVSVPIKFGPFEVSPDSGELRKNGTRPKLTGQAIQVLITLSEKPGRIVTREELQQKLWPGASFGDFEHGINAVIKRLRDALGDSAAQPKFIETIPLRGYRFIAAVEERTHALAPSISHARAWMLVGSAAALTLLLVSAALNVGGMREAVFGLTRRPISSIA